MMFQSPRPEANCRQIVDEVCRGRAMLYFQNRPPKAGSIPRPSLGDELPQPLPDIQHSPRVQYLGIRMNCIVAINPEEQSCIIVRLRHSPRYLRDSTAKEKL